jgi:putative copper resistance protein D
MNLLSENLTATNSLVSTLATVNKSLLIVSSFAFVGILLAFAFLLLEREGVLQESAQKLRKFGSASVSIWAITSFSQIILTLANILGGSVGNAFDSTTFRSFVTQVDLGRFLFAQTFNQWSRSQFRYWRLPYRSSKAIQHHRAPMHLQLDLSLSMSLR